ncbi:MAG: hypothetical protein KJO21_03735 [Verrucomicrobiae bacterium]|nr:hypothetical protein [Verrucomicrobiae bacterium]NNJ42610.1 hypothetical protein [Akkermansiaceae bacterium]
MNPITNLWRRHKKGLSCLTSVMLLTGATTAQNLPTAGVQATVDESGAGSVTLTAKGVLPKPPLFFKAGAEAAVNVTPDQITQEVALTLSVLQGRPELLTLGLHGAGDIVSVTGAGLADWAVRTSADGKNRYLDIKPVLVKDQPGPRELKLMVRSRYKIKSLPATPDLLTINPGMAAGLTLKVDIKTQGLDLKVAQIFGMYPLEQGGSFHSSGSNSLTLQLNRSGASPADAELRGVRITGRVDEKLGSTQFTLTAWAHVTSDDGGTIDLLSGRAAISRLDENADYQIKLAPGPKGGRVYQLAFDRAGKFPVQLNIIARIDDDGAGWKNIDFVAPQGAVVPVQLTGLDDDVEFNKNLPLRPQRSVGAWRGFLPATGHCYLAWKKGRKAGEGKLAYTSKGLTDVTVGAGLMRQETKIDLKVLQGKINQLSLRMDGPGEVLDVEGTHVAAWSVVADAAGSRRLSIQLSLPVNNSGVLKIRSQQALDQFPVTATPLRLTPMGVLRHSGHVRLSNAGAVRLETSDVKGMMQLSPEQFPSGGLKARQVFVFRYPSAEYAWAVQADQILPEVSLNEVVVYQQTESDRIIQARVELDIREAPLREWELRVPDGFAVASLSGAEVADYVVGSAVEKGMRDIKVLFKKAVSGRQLISLRLEKNAPAAAGVWQLPVLEFTGAKSVRGHIGISAAAGWRVIPGDVSGLTETPLSYFPVKNPDIQQTYRFREQGWSASMKIEAREQSVQADVFHLYSLKEGMAYGSALMNYYVVGAPVNQWELSIPQAFGNVTIEGQNVRQWRREQGDRVIVQLEQPVSGAATLLVTFENAMSARGGLLRLGEVHPLNVQGESGFIEVVSPVLLRHEVTQTSPGLLGISAQELPAEFRMLTTAPALAAWQYAARPFELEIDIAWYEPGKTLEQVVDFAELSSRVSRDGQVMTEATFYVRTRGRQALRMTLPDDTRLWDARADGKTITARADGAQYLLPLPAGDDPNNPVKVIVRYGGVAGKGSKVALGAPTLTAPIIIAGWKVSAEKGRLLTPSGDDTGVRRAPLTQTGFESLQDRGAPLAGLALLFLGGIYGLRRKKPAGWTRALSMLGWLVVIIISVALAGEVQSERRVNQRFLEITAQIVSVDSPVNITLNNIAPWQAMVSWMGIIIAAVGAVAVIGSLLVKKWSQFWVRGLAVAAMAGGVLAQRGGGIVFFYLLAIIALILLLLAVVKSVNHWNRWMGERARRRKKEREEIDEAISLGSAEGAAKLLVMAAVVGSLLMGSATQVDAAAADARAIDSITQTWNIEKDRLFATMEIKLNGKAGASHLLLREPAVLTSFAGDGLRVSKLKQGKSTVWMLAVDRAGPLTATATYEMVMPAKHASFTLPTGPASVQKITADVDEVGLELYSDAAVQTRRDAASPDQSNRVELILAPHKKITIGLRVRGRDVDSEKTKFFAELANLYLPSPGVVDGNHRVTIRPSSGKVDNIALTVPAGFAVSEVAGPAVGNWRFDPASRQLLVDLEPAQSRAFTFMVETQRGLDALPAEVMLQSLTVSRDAGETNMIGLAFGPEAQPGKITVNKLSVVNVDDFDRSLIPRNSSGRKIPRGILHKVYRSASGVGSLTLQVAPVKPEVRVVSEQELTLGSERILLSASLNVNITRAGIFKLSLNLPDGMEVESLSGPSLSHWTESKQKDTRVVTLHLSGKTLGAQKFALSLSGPPAVEEKNWAVPRLMLNEAIRQSGQLLVMPEKGIRVRAIDRKNVSRMNTQSSLRGQQVDPRVKKSGGLAFRLLQSDWALSLAIEKLDPWITAKVLHEVTLREGQTRTRISAIYQIEHAAVKHIRVELSGLSEEEARTVRASGTAVKDIIKVEGDPDTWELRFRRGILGSVHVQIEYQRVADRGNGGAEEINPAVFAKAKRLIYFMAVRTTGRLDMQAGKSARGWRRSDWTAVPKKLRNPADTSMPDLCYRLNEPEGSLSVALKRHQMADTLKLRVTGGKMVTIFSPHGDTLTSVNLETRVLEKSTLRISLPAGAALYNVLVNGDSVHVVREGDDHLFHVSPGPVETEPAVVSLVYSTPSAAGDIKLTAPGFNVPLESLEWDVLVPEGYRLDGHAGGFEMRGSQGMRDYTLEDYLAAIRSSRTEDAQKGQQSLKKANDYLRQGKRKQAAKELSKVTKNFAVDQASNEDARVQLRQLQTQQALWGLNTRRQRIYLDNKAAGNAAIANSDLEDSALNNPLFQGQQEFDVRQVDDFLRGNSQEEKKSLKVIANRLITQQIATEPAPQTISTIVRGRGEVLRFTRGIQVDGGKELGLELDIDSTRGVQTTSGILLLLGIGFTGAIALRRKS